MEPVPTAIAVAVTEAARSILRPRRLPDALDAIVRAARDTVPGFDHAGISVTHADGSIETLAGTDQLVWDLDHLQYELDEGPCVEAMRHEPVVVVEDAASEARWPRYMPRAAESGLRAQLAMRIFTEGRTLGGLNLYSTSSPAVLPDAVLVGELFTTHAAVALDHDRHEHELTEALASRKVIGQAIGIVMQRYRMGEDRALQFLIRVSSTSNTKLRLVAEQVVSEANAEYASPTDV